MVLKYMDNIKDDLYFVNKIIADLEFVVKHTFDKNEVEFYQNEILIDSIMFRMIQISENVKRLSQEFKNFNEQVPWINIVGLRNRIVHDYGKLDLKIIYDTVKINLPELLILLNTINRY